MVHYSEVQWELFITGQIDETLYEEMLQHSLECEDCLKLYLDLLEKSNSPDLIPGEDFTDRVMNCISNENKLMLEKKRKINRANLIIYYTSAASITLFLFWSGIFQGISGSLPQTGKHVGMIQSTAAGIFVSGWTERLSDNTDNIINNINNRRSFNEKEK